MSLSGVMTNALAGMKVTQSGLEVVSQNISNADSVGYIRRKISAVEQPLGDMSGFARTTGVQRLLDRVVQRQLWSETSGAGYTATRSNMLNALDQVYGPPASGNTLGAVFSRFTQSLQQLKADPSNTTLRSSVAVAAQDMATRLGGLSSDVQSLRLEAEEGLAAGVARSNEILKQIQSVNTKITATPNAASSASLNDERDRLVTELSRYIDIRTSEDGNGSLNIFTSSGVTLFGGSNAVTLSFDAAGAMSADALWNTDDAQRGVGTIRVQTGFGGATDLIASNALRSGELAALVELRDKTLVQAQNQLDEFAAGMASALSDRIIAGTPVNLPAGSGFDVDLANLSPGNQFTLDFTNPATGAKGRFTFVRAESAATAAAINNAGMSSADNLVIGVNFSGMPGSMASVLADVNAALTAAGGGFIVANPGGTNLRILGDSALNSRTVSSLAARPTVTTTQSAQSPPPAERITELPFFVDKGAANGPYTGSFEGRPQMRGLSARIAVNPDIAANRALLVQYSSSSVTPQGESSRVDKMFERLTDTARMVSPQTGIGGTAASWRGTIANFAQRIVETQGNVIESARRLNDGQQIALKSIEGRFSEMSGVSVDQEMSDLVSLQNAYSANARVISAVKEMLDVLLRI